MINKGTLTSNKSLQISNLFSNHSILTNSNKIRINTSGTLNNSGSLTNQANDSTLITNYGILANVVVSETEKGTITNNGQIVNETTGTFKNHHIFRVKFFPMV